MKNDPRTQNDRPDITTSAAPDIERKPFVRPTITRHDQLPAITAGSIDLEWDREDVS